MGIGEGFGMRVEIRRSFVNPKEISGRCQLASHLHACRQIVDFPVWVLFGKRANPVNALNYALSRLDHLRAS